jgi:hypothetical protein
MLGSNLGLMERLFPLCEKFSSSIAQLNQTLAKHESELEWLTESSENETSAREKEILYDELKQSVRESEGLMNNLEGALSAHIIDELNTIHQSECDELIADLNENIDRVKFKFGYTHTHTFIYEYKESKFSKFNILFLKLKRLLNTHLSEYELALESRRLKIREIYGEIDDLLEWLDEVDTKFSQIDSLSHDPDVIKVQLNEQCNLNEEIVKQRDKLKQLVEESKLLIRQRAIDDSIELKEKLSGLQVQSASLHKQGLGRLNELEQAFAIAKNFGDAQKLLSLWFDEIGEQLENLNSGGTTAAGGTGTDMMKHELNLIKQIERNLGEKKVR